MSNALGLYSSFTKYGTSFGVKGHRYIFAWSGHKGISAQYPVYISGRNVQTLSTCETLPVMIESTHVVAVVAMQKLTGYFKVGSVLS